LNGEAVALSDLEVERRIDDAIDQLVRALPPAQTDQREFWAAQFGAGLAWVDLPVRCGGWGLAPRWRPIVDQKLRAAGASFENVRLNPMGHGLGAVTVAVHGTQEQHGRYLPPLFTSEEIWCQLFSEPGAGSDLAALATSAERDGSRWVVNGQKVWSSFAANARRGLLVARTNPDVTKHRGLTVFVLDMMTPGVEVRPLREMTGGAQFNEVFLSDTVVPDADRLGSVDGGWSVVLTTLMNERVLLSGALPEPGAGPISDLVKIWREHGDGNPARRDQVMTLWIQSECMRFTNARASLSAAAGQPGPEGAIGKLMSAELNQSIYELCLTVLGPGGMLEVEGGNRHTYLESDGAITWAFERSRANTIEGGTSEVMRNIIAERVLGLPGDIRVDRDLPWSQVRRT
jgi:alkylation response protein AidB-like acyl-CoA dehydrogenase